jgi:hypothetical protein
MVILPGGELGKLLKWWNAQDGSECCWQVEFIIIADPMENTDFAHAKDRIFVRCEV